jgi:nitrogen regulatory protein PII
MPGRRDSAVATKASRITCIVNKDISAKVAETLAAAGLTSYAVQSGRGVVLRERARLFGLTKELVLEDDPVDVYRVYVPPRSEEHVLSLLAENADLATAGRGSVFSEEVTLEEGGADLLKKVAGKARRQGARFAADLTGICCIVQRGQANPIIRSLLETGAVPTVTYGEGMGVRDKLGLLRIAIPAEKELVSAVVSHYDAEPIMQILIDVGRLDQPGKGFVYLFPVHRGLINTKTQRGQRGQGASMEQIVSAIDALKGSAQWRKMETVTRASAKRRYLRDLMNLNLLANDGTVMDIARAALSVGAPGATISRFRQIAAGAEGESTAREMADLVVGKPQVALIAKTVKSAGLFKPGAAGAVETRSIPIACTYLGKA